MRLYCCDAHFVRERFHTRGVAGNLQTQGKKDDTAAEILKILELMYVGTDWASVRKDEAPPELFAPNPEMVACVIITLPSRCFSLRATGSRRPSWKSPQPQLRRGWCTSRTLLGQLGGQGAVINVHV